MASRIVIEEPCEHGKMGQHLLAERRFDGCDLCRSGEHGYPGDPHFDCPGGSRRVLTEGEYVLIEKVDGGWQLPIQPSEFVHGILDALAGGES